MSGHELDYVKEAFTSNWISPVGPHIDHFEQELCEYCGVGYGVSLSSGTSAIHLALIILGIGKGDEVICSTFTFAGTCNPIIYQGATPVFVDSERDTWNLDPFLLEEAIEDRIKKGKKPKAIILVHLYGMPAQLSAIQAIAGRFDIPIIEDAAEAIGSAYFGKKLGSFGQLGIFSFNGNKIITTSGGGALVSENSDWISRAKFLSTQARDPAPHYQHSEIGYNYRLSNVCAGIGRGQLRVLDQRVSKKRAIFDAYQHQLSADSFISFQPESAGSFSNRWLTAITFKGDGGNLLPEKVRVRLEQNNIESRPLWKPMHLQPVFSAAPYYGSGVSDDLFARGLCLPSGTTLTLEDISRVASLIKSVI